jgi:beta-glucosidase
MECVVLLKNEKHLLPLTKDSSIAVIGDFDKKPKVSRHGKLSSESLQVGFVRGIEFNCMRVPKSLCTLVVIVRTMLRIPTYSGRLSMPPRMQIQPLVFCGLPEIYESEGFDRPHMDMPPTHNALIDAVCAAIPRTVVILSNEAPLSMPWVDKPGAILEGYLAGQGGASGIVDLIFGAASPCGKLAETFPICLEDIASNVRRQIGKDSASLPHGDATPKFGPFIAIP